MASLQTVTLTILSSATTSDLLTGSSLRNARSLSIQAPATLTGTITVECGNSDSAGATFATVQSPPGTDVTVAAGKSSFLNQAPFQCLRLKSSGAEGGDRVFTVTIRVGE